MVQFLLDVGADVQVGLLLSCPFKLCFVLQKYLQVLYEVSCMILRRNSM